MNKQTSQYCPELKVGFGSEGYNFQMLFCNLTGECCVGYIHSDRKTRIHGNLGKIYWETIGHCPSNPIRDKLQQFLNADQDSYQQAFEDLLEASK